MKSVWGLGSTASRAIRRIAPTSALPGDHDRLPHAGWAAGAGSRSRSASSRVLAFSGEAGTLLVVIAAKLDHSATAAWSVAPMQLRAPIRCAHRRRRRCDQAAVVVNEAGPPRRWAEISAVRERGRSAVGGAVGSLTGAARHRLGDLVTVGGRPVRSAPASPDRVGDRRGWLVGQISRPTHSAGYPRILRRSGGQGRRRRSSAQHLRRGEQEYRALPCSPDRRSDHRGSTRFGERGGRHSSSAAGWRPAVQRAVPRRCSWSPPDARPDPQALHLPDGVELPLGYRNGPTPAHRLSGVALLRGELVYNDGADVPRLGMPKPIFVIRGQPPLRPARQ